MQHEPSGSRVSVQQAEQKCCSAWLPTPASRITLNQVGPTGTVVTPEGQGGSDVA
jgi:hypothetical protein